MDLVEEEFEIGVKVIVVGNGGVGKTSLIQKFAKGIFTDTYKKTIGVDFLEKQMTLPSRSEEVRMMLWDTAGQEEFDAVTRTYYRGAGACVIAFSTTDRKSFEDVRKWKAKVVAETGAIPMVLIQTKIDLLDESAVSNEEAVALADELGLRFYRTSVKEGLHVDAVFCYLAERYIDQSHEEVMAEPIPTDGFMARDEGFDAGSSAPAAQKASAAQQPSQQQQQQHQSAQSQQHQPPPPSSAQSSTQPASGSTAGQRPRNDTVSLTAQPSKSRTKRRSRC